ncbi:putative iron-sulfur-binding oxidoreductase FadF [Moorella thermoacetica]|uniref:Iron-sulfur-binding oxidoreductase FadF n=1 Tax=Neomoorella thermoacetica TaxID=1525 RepID=A0AAC9MV57_NEOTH|nr:(Fe-S)-binding protein [Moorella thermoacetica]AOQ24181.1 succinate dehydrogenase/fumarate reductase iron-sulfur subunit [Moorella thermoacetica]TYL14588.1 putative iron-sulfur-binding oxidoreductase FadF [Moorella thermoacetica]
MPFSPAIEESLFPPLYQNLHEKITGALGEATLRSCLTCGVCSGGCPTGDIGAPVDPRKIVRLLLWGMEDKVLASDMIWLCTMCGRCTVYCPVGVNMGDLVRALRSHLAEEGRVPENLQKVVDLAVTSGNNMGISREDYLDTLDWMQEELQAEFGPRAEIPVDKKGARVMYVINPREAKFFPLSILAAAKVFYAAGESWTLSSRSWDATNYALFSGDDKAGAILVQRLADEVERLGCQELIMTECGHAFRAIRWGPERWLGHKLPFPVRSIVQLMAEYLDAGRIRLDPTRNSEPVTYHDPCNLGRKEGIFEEPRRVLKAAVTDFREMTPNRENNYCCGGGGGMLSLSEFGQERLAKGKVKIEQIQRTGAGIVATPCHNCVDQLNDLCRHYHLNVKVKNLVELVADALVIAGKE